MNKSNATSPSIQELGQSPDALAKRQADLVALIRQAAPDVMAENQIDVEKLKDLLGQERIASDEHYELNWAGKSAARREIQKTSSLTLRPDANNPANAQHMLIEGENLEVLRVLQKSYYGKVKMIYIDPPYNTGNDSFVYPDNYSETLDEYQRRTGEKNETGYLNKQSLWKKNSKESGQYHSAWLSMMYPRLYLARNLLRDDGVIFISIDDTEVGNLRLLCDEIFGAENFVANIVWHKKYTRSNDAKWFSDNHDHVLCYGKNKSNLKFNLLPRTEDQLAAYSNPDGHQKGKWKATPLHAKSGTNATAYQFTNGVVWKPPVGTYRRFNDESMKEMDIKNEIWFGTDGSQTPSRKSFLIDVKDGVTPVTLWSYDEAGHNHEASNELKDLGLGGLFTNPKPSRLIKLALLLGTEPNDLVVDFFAGSGTTAHAVIAKNLEDGGNRQSISVQMPEVLDKDSEAYKAGYRTIADITRARIDKVMAKIKAEHPDNTADLACAHFTLAPSNFKVWRGDVNDAEALREQLSMFQSAEKTGQSKQADAQTAMLTELLLKHGLGALGVHAIAKPRLVAGVTVHRVLMADDKTMWLCFETYTDALKDEIVKAMPAQVVMLNSCFVGAKADEQLANLQLELTSLDIGLTVI